MKRNNKINFKTKVSTRVVCRDREEFYMFVCDLGKGYNSYFFIKRYGKYELCYSDVERFGGDKIIPLPYTLSLSVKYNPNYDIYKVPETNYKKVKKRFVK